MKEARKFWASPQLWRDSEYCCIRPVIISDPPVGQIIEPEIRLLESEIKHPIISRGHGGNLLISSVN